MRRQLGAENVDLDTQTGWAQFTLPEPAEIDYAAFERAADDASYTIKRILLDVTGKATIQPCAHCARNVTSIRVPETGQVFELASDLPPAGSGDTPVRVKAITDDWRGAHVVFEILEVIPTGDPEKSASP